MAESFSELRRDVSTFLVSLRNSVDGAFRGKSSTADDDRERYLRTMMMVEEARIRFNAYSRFREPTATEWKAARAELLAFADRFRRAEDTDPDIFGRRFRLSPPLNRENSSSSRLMQQFAFDREDFITVAEALIAFREYIAGSQIAFAPVQTELSFGDLESIVPRQQVAPVQFEIINNRIVVTNRSPRSHDADKENIKSAFEHIKYSGDQLIDNLEKSNCDKRLLESVKELQSQLISNGNIVKIGLTNMGCGIMSAQFQSELPGALVAMFNSYNTSISLYVSQFPEWDNFIQKAAIIDLDDSDIAEVDSAARDLIADLYERVDLVDPEVPKTISFVRQFLSFPGSSAKRAAFAMIRTIENLVSSILRFSVSFFNKTAEKTIESGSTVASRVIIGLLGVALVGAAGVGSAAVRAGAPWVKQAAEIVERHIEKSME